MSEKPFDQASDTGESVTGPTLVNQPGAAPGGDADPGDDVDPVQTGEPATGPEAPVPPEVTDAAALDALR